LSEQKQLELASFLMQYLGFLIHTPGWLWLGRLTSASNWQTYWMAFCQLPPVRLLQNRVALLGLVRNWAVVAHLAMYLSLCLQHQLNDATRNAWGSMSHHAKWVWNESNCCWIRHWYWQYCIQLDVATIRDLCLLWS
jgi:hypothetical protein